jgi:hypothetical protein
MKAGARMKTAAEQMNKQFSPGLLARFAHSFATPKQSAGKARLIAIAEPWFAMTGCCAILFPHLKMVSAAEFWEQGGGL